MMVLDLPLRVIILLTWIIHPNQEGGLELKHRKLVLLEEVKLHVIVLHHLHFLLNVVPRAHETLKMSRFQVHLKNLMKN